MKKRRTWFQQETRGIFFLLLVFGIMLLSMSLYEALKVVLFPTPHSLQSCFATIIMSALVSTLLLYVIFHFHLTERTNELEKINQQLQAEIAEHTRTEKALHTSEEQYRLLFENLQDVFYRTDIDGNIILVSPSVVQLLGYSQEEALRLNLRNDILACPEQWPEFVNFIQESRFLDQVEILLTRSDGSAVWGSFKSQWFTDSTGKILGIEGLIRDITDRKHAEEVLQHAKDEAEHAQRITENALRVAESANQAKSEFLANMSHELRTPLNSILGYAQILRRHPSLSEQQREMAEIMGRSGEHLLMMINHVLDLSRIEAGKMELTPTDFSLPNLVETVGEIAKIQAEQKGISLDYELTPELQITVRGDETRLRQILLNLLGNAVKFTEQGRVTMRVTPINRPQIASADRQQNHVLCVRRIRFEIIDTGVGIPDEQLEEIFEPFRQVKDTRIQSKGLGLGLAISQQLVHMMNSDLHVKSSVNQGSVFWFDVDLPEIEMLMTSPVRLTRPIVGMKGENCRMLIVDDDSDNRKVLKTVLAPLGFKIREASSGGETLQKAEIEPPDVILMDLVMPELDGFETTRQLRQRSSGKAPIIIALSANAFEQTRLRSLAAGCDDFLPKPIDIDKLLTRLEKHLHIEWIYEQEDKESPVMEPIPKNLQMSEILVESCIPPPSEELVALIDLVRKGDMISIPVQADRLERLDPQYRPFVRTIRHFAKTFQIDSLERFITQYLDEIHNQTTQEAKEKSYE